MSIRENLKKIVYYLSGEIGPRSYLRTEALRKSAAYIISEFGGYGYDVFSRPYTVKDRIYENIYVEKKGVRYPEKILVVGAHYDTATGTPGADDNASGIAGLLELARLVKEMTFDKTVRFAAFTLEEPPFYRTENMGSYRFAKSLRDNGEDIEGMICIEMIGYFSDLPKSQFFPATFFKWFYPEQGNFILLAGNLSSKGFLLKVKEGFEKGSDLPVESISTLPLVPGIDFSDNWAFYKMGYNAVMVTDTAFYRNPYYHDAGDTPDTLDYDRMADVVTGLRSAILAFAVDG
ncbi:aminopeptidase YwaD precursor [bacterium BMS3Abin07]|nr:aminopeptidase YwaD precursor [bacterium BMS3Abin07]GBE33318.1 aminopeptidase YwaD precursor [bacterium BMS3Bbin05]HDL21304.1 M28 family peptidase [Nitrospirota bacterium]HDO22223.1 M28 family peptidase [Nitrospirota bacterium]HDZ88042.1 M28 family peptidase [Nitrospirota bacterium]